VGDSAAEDIDHQFDIRGQIGTYVDYGIDVHRTEDFPHLVVVGSVGENPLDACWEDGGGLAPIKDHDLVAGAGQLMHEGEAIELGTAHDENSHCTDSFS
jgi:hypothetical protein